jgi:DNA-binding HxlR family transcriptional regulator
MTDRRNPAECGEIQEMLNELEGLGVIRRNGESQDGQPVYEITEFGQRASPDVLDDQTANKPQ